MLLSAGDFAIYRAESQVFNLLLPRFGDLTVRKNRQRLISAWVQTGMFGASGLDSSQIAAKILDECRNYGDFLRITMEEIAAKQNVHRWAECTPEHLLNLREIKETIPGALMVHIIRDGRDVALSMNKQGWVRPFWWDKERRLVARALYWRWMVKKGREDGRVVAPSYTEVFYEELLAEPRRVLARIGQFINHDLDYDRIVQAGIGSVSRPNTSFECSDEKGTFNPVGRWKKLLSPRGLKVLEDLIGDLLTELKYPLTALSGELSQYRFSVRLTRALYDLRFDAKQWAKTRTRLNEIWHREVPILAPYSAAPKISDSARVAPVGGGG
jgi:hypothetical protein